MNCWEFMNCREDTYKKCPAYPNQGLDCWKVTGTWCAKGTIQKATAKEKITHCRTCNFYQQHANKY